ncbi:MAG: sodium:solute symporter family protein [Methanoculleaceae archaeon]
MTASPLTIGIVVAYFLIMIGIGAWASRKIHNTEDYIIAGRSLGFWVFTILVVASICSGMTLLGVSGLGYAAGWPTIWEQIFVPLSASFAIIAFGVKLNEIGAREDYLTIQDYFAQRFESPRILRGLSAVAGIVVSLIYLVGQYTAISIILVWLFGIQHWQALIIAGLVIALYTTIGGLYAVSWTTLFQGVILILGVILLAPPVIIKAGGMTHVNRVLAGINPALVQPWLPSGAPAFTPEFLVSFGLLLVIGLACAPHVVNNVLAAGDKRYFRWSPLIAFCVYAVVMFLVKFVGFAGRAMVEEGMITLPDMVNAQDYIFITGVEAASANVLVWGFFAVIVLAAVMSTTDRLMLTVGSLFGWDIYHNLLRPDASDRHVLLVSRITVIIAAVVTLLLAINPPEMLAWLIWMGIGVMLATFAVPLLAGLYWRRATRAGAIASMAGGLVAAGFFGYWYQFVDRLPMHFSLYALAVSAILMVVVSLLTTPNSREALDRTLTGWFIQHR